MELPLQSTSNYLSSILGKKLSNTMVKGQIFNDGFLEEGYDNVANAVSFSAIILNSTFYHDVWRGNIESLDCYLNHWML